MMIKGLFLQVLLAPAVFAFTNGTLLPGYLCGRLNDGMPKSLGAVLKYAKEDVPVLAFTANATQNANVTVSNTVPPNAAFIVASFHSQYNSIDAQQNIITVSIDKELDRKRRLRLTLTSRDPTLAINGVLIFAEDRWGRKIGTFCDHGGKFSFFKGCGHNRQHQPAGVVHHQLVSDNSTYTLLDFIAPRHLDDDQIITIRGLSATDGGYGYHCTQFKVGSKNGVPCQVVSGKLVGTGVEPQDLDDY